MTEKSLNFFFKLSDDDDEEDDDDGADLDLSLDGKVRIIYIKVS